MIKKYNQFFEDSKWDISFIDAVDSVDSVDVDNFSSMASEVNVDPEKDYQEFQNEMDKYKWNIETIKIFFDINGNHQFRNEEDVYDYLDEYGLLDKSGGIDYYLYRTMEMLGLDKNRIPLGGAGFGDLDVTEDEAFIKYSYGYHKTPYGKLFMAQIDISEEEFRLKASTYLLEYLHNELSYDLYRDLSNKGDNLKLNLNKYILDEMDSDRIIILTQSLSDSIKSLTETYISKEKIDAWFVDKCGDVSLECVSTNEELVIYIKNID